MNFFVEPDEGHDDYLVSAALARARVARRARSASPSGRVSTRSETRCVFGTGEDARDSPPTGRLRRCTTIERTTDPRKRRSTAAAARSACAARPAYALVRNDTLPENTDYRDTGCDLCASCLRCPLARCQYDARRGGLPPRSMTEARDREIAFIRRRHGAPDQRARAARTASPAAASSASSANNAPHDPRA